MFSTSTKIKLFLLATLSFFLFPKPALAYLDPGTGSYIFQMLIASLVGASLFFKSFIRKFKELRGGSSKTESENETEE